MQYRHEIDGLRAVAVIAIMFFHTQSEYFSGGFVGVDMFFVISGYLITGLIITAKQEASFSLLGFYVNRARRLLPALLTVILFCIPVAWLWMFSNQYLNFSQSVIAAGLFGTNILFWFESQAYFTTSIVGKPLLHTWSLAVEEQFYFIYPVVLLLLLRYAKRFTVLGIALLTALFLAYTVFFIDNPLTRHYMLHARFWLFGVGALTFFMRQKWALGKGAFSGALAFTGLILMMLWLLSFNNGSIPSELPRAIDWWSYLSVLGIIVVILFSDQSNSVGRFLATPVLAGVGLISYSLYLWHYPIFVFARIRLLEVPMFGYLGLSVLTFIAAYLSWRFVEVPCRIRRRLGSRHFYLYCALAWITIMSVGAYGVLQGGYVIGMTPADNVLKANYGLSPTCEFVDRATECKLGPSPEILVWGDSFAMHTVDTILATQSDAQLLQFTKSACSPLSSGVNASLHIGRRSDECRDFNQSVLSSLDRWPSVQYLVISSRFSNYFNHQRYETLNRQQKRAYVDQLQNSLLSLLNQIKNNNITPIVISEPRRPTQAKIYCAAHALKFGLDHTSCNFPSSEISNAQVLVKRLLKGVSSEYKVIYLDQVICPDSRCLTVDDDTALYTHSGHLSRNGALLIGTKLDIYNQIKTTNR